MKKALAFFTVIFISLFLMGCELSNLFQNNNSDTSIDDYIENTVTEDIDVAEPANVPDAANRAEWAGFRSSPYGFGDSPSDFPSTSSWKSYLDKMKSFYKKNKTDESNGTLVWLVGVVTDDSTMPGISCYLNFPKPDGVKIPDGLAFSNTDENEKYFKSFDEKGYSVWLQVESGFVDIVDLSKIVMNQYKNHKCVKGFGIDVEWYKNVTDGKPGTPLDDTTASNVDAAVKKIRPAYSVFVKHWRTDYLPETYRGVNNDMIFVTDSQGLRKMDNLKKTYRRWAENYAPNPVFFQTGYENDEGIWGELEKPLRDLGKEILDGMLESNVEAVKTQKKGIIWVDFTLKDAWTKSK